MIIGKRKDKDRPRNFGGEGTTSEPKKEILPCLRLPALKSSRSSLFS
jgi:hypothetical protein